MASTSSESGSSLVISISVRSRRGGARPGPPRGAPPPGAPGPAGRRPAGRGGRLAQEEQVDLAEGQRVAVAKLAPLLPGAVDEGAVLAAEIDDEGAPPGRLDQRVPAREALVGDGDVLLLAAAEGDRGFAHDER